MSWLSIADAKTAAGGSNTGAFILGYNGVRLDTFAATPSALPATGLASTDRTKVTNGLYSAWGFEQLFYLSGNTNSAAVYSELQTRLNSATVIGTAGIPLGEMNVTRPVDGGPIIPK
jgi:hypothetical protein